MKFSKVVFTHPLTVPFKDPSDPSGRLLSVFSTSVGSLCTYDNPTTTKLDSLEADGAWVIAKLGEQRMAIPAASIECCELEPEQPRKGKAAA